jgi:hypothetical protein
MNWKVYSKFALKTLSSDCNCGDSSQETYNELNFHRPHVGQLSLMYGFIMTSFSLKNSFISGKLYSVKIIYL